MGRKLMYESFSDFRGQLPGTGHSVIGLDVNPRIVDVRHSDGGQNARSQQEVPAACVALVVMDGIVALLAQYFAEFLGKLQ